MVLPYKFRELFEAFRAILSREFTIKYPYEPSLVPEGFRGKLNLDAEKCIGCGACVEGCPTGALTLQDREDKREITLSYPNCIFCGQCVERCPVNAINFTSEFSITSTKREELFYKLEKNLIRCEICGAPITTVDHLKWIIANLGTLALSNASLLIVAYELSFEKFQKKAKVEGEPERQDLIRILCPKCKRKIIALDHGWRIKY